MDYDFTHDPNTQRMTKEELPETITREDDSWEQDTQDQ